MRRIRGLKSLIHDAIDHTVDLVEDGHESSSRAVMRVLSRSGPLAEPAHQVDQVRRVITTGVLSTIKGVNQAVAFATDAGLDLFTPPQSTEEAPLPLRSDLMGTAAWAADAAIGAANGVVGDHIAHQKNGLDLGMRLRTAESWVGLDGHGIPADVSPRIVVLVHGLATTEWSWCMDAERQLGDVNANFGSLLQADLDYTPIYVRYNTGRHISQNGRELARLLDSLVEAWPVPVQQLVLVGHSMGGLVARSACHHGHLDDKPWVRLVSDAFTLSSPLQGAPLEKFGNLATAALGAIDLPSTRIPARLINGRSSGIKDLRYGYVRDQDWQGLDPDALAQDGRTLVSLPEHIRWCFISATLADSPDHLVSQAVGDLLVRVESASGPADAPPVRVMHHVGGMHHVTVQVHPAVYDIIKSQLGTGLTPV